MANIPLKSIKFPGLPDIYTIESDLSEEAKEALLACFRHVAWADGQGQNCYNALENALQQNKPDPTGMVSLNVSYSQPYILDAGTNIDLLKQNLIVVGEYSDGREARISSAYYTLTGIIDGSGRNTITVSYANLSSQFTVLSAPSNRWVNDVLTITNDALTGGSINYAAPDYSYGRTDRLAYRGFWLDFDPNYKYTIIVNSSKSINVGVRTFLVGQMNSVRVEEDLSTMPEDSKWQDSGFVTNATGEYANADYKMMWLAFRRSNETTISASDITSVVIQRSLLNKHIISQFDFTKNLVDTKGLFTPVLTHTEEATKDATLTSNGLTFNEPTQIITFGNIDPIGKTFEFDVSNFSFVGDNTHHIRLLMFSNGLHGTSPLVYRSGQGYQCYGYTESTGIGKGWCSTVWPNMQGASDDIINMISGKTVKIHFLNNNTIMLWLDQTFIGTLTGQNCYFNSDAAELPDSSIRSARRLTFGGVELATSTNAGDQCYNLTLTGFRVYDY